MLRTRTRSCVYLALLFATAIGGPQSAIAQGGGSEAASAASAMPLASIVGASVGASVALPVALSAAGAALVVRAVEASAHGVVYVLERVSDGARVSVQLSAGAARSASVAVGTVATVSVIASGVALSVAGNVIAFVPNEVGKALLHSTKVTE